jgi:hypothetical protein
MSSALESWLRNYNPDGSRRPARGIDTRTVAEIYGVGLGAASSGKLPPPANAAAAAGNSPLIVPQAAMVVGEPIPVIWGRRRGTVGGVLVFPKATESRFENDSSTVTSRYHMVLGEGRFPGIQRRDVRCGECRIGTFSQNFNQRAGSWTPGNFATAQTAYTVPTFPTFTGGGGNYQGLSTFEAGASFTGGSDDWRTGWNIFLRGGTIVERGRLLDSSVDSSDNLADLVLWALQRSGRVPDAMIDLTSLASAAQFLEANGLWCNGEFSSSTNLGDWLIRILPDFLLRETKIGGKFGLRPLLPTNSNGTINTGTIAPDWVLTEAAIIPDSLQIEYSEAASRRPVAMAMLWRQQHDDTDVPIVRTLTVGDVNASGPVEQHDLSQYATTENHAARVGAYLYARRTLSTHSVTAKLKAGTQTGTIAEGDIVQIYLPIVSSREPVGTFNRYYQVESIGYSLTGEETLSLSHFPVDATGRSLLALAVDAATAPGEILSSNRTGGSCDIAGASSSTTVPASSTSGTPISGQGTSGSHWAASGQFIDLFNGFGAIPNDSPPVPGGGGATQLAQGGGAIPPSDGTNSSGGDARCPFGYYQLVGTIYWVQLTGPTDAIGRTTSFTATDFPVATPGTAYTYGVWTITPYTVTWTDPTAGAQSVVLTGATGTNGTVTLTGEFSVEASGYTCATESGTAGTPVTQRLYKTQPGDTFASISQKFYGTTSRANDIANANPWLLGIDIFAIESWGTWGPGGGFWLTIPT